MNDLPIAIFTNNHTQNDNLTELAVQIIRRTQQVFEKGASNRYADLYKNPCAFYEVQSARGMQVLPDFKTEDMDILVGLVKESKLSEQQFKNFFDVLHKVLRCFISRIGNCGEHSAVGLYFASIDGIDSLLAVSIELFNNLDHCVIKLESKDGRVVYVDPWFVNKKNSGAIFYPSSLNAYLNELFYMLRANENLKFIGPIYPARYLIGLAMLVWTINASDVVMPIAAALLGICAFLISNLNFIVLYYLSETTFKAKITLSNADLEYANISLKFFAKLCDQGLGLKKPAPMLLSARAANLQTTKMPSELLISVRPSSKHTLQPML